VIFATAGGLVVQSCQPHGHILIPLKQQQKVKTVLLILVIRTGQNSKHRVSQA